MIEVSQVPVSLRKPQPKPEGQTKKPRRAKSVSRGADSIMERTLEQERIKLVRTRQIQEKLRAEREKEEEQYLTPRKRTPVVAKKRTPQNTSPWDEDGRLRDRGEIITTPKKVENEEPVPKFKSCMNKTSVDLLEKSEHLSLADRQLIPRKKYGRRARSMSMSQESFELFVTRQERAAHRKIAVTHEKPRRYSSVMSPMSRKIAETAETRREVPMWMPPKRNLDVDEFSFRPDMSLTSDYKVTGLGCKESAMRKIITNIRLDGERMEMLQRQMARCTFSPDFSRTRDKWPNDASPISSEKRQSDKIERYKELERKVRAGEQNEEEMAQYIRFVHEIPEKQMPIHEMMAMFRIEKRKNRDPIDTGRKKQRSASVPRVSK